MICLQKKSDMYDGVSGTARATAGDSVTRPIQDWKYAAGAGFDGAGGAGQDSAARAGLEMHYLSRNTTGNAAIKTVEMEIQSSIGCYTVAGDKPPFLRTRAELYRDHLRYMPDGYMDQQTWYKHNCCFMIGVDQYARGLCTNGEAFPITIKARVVFESARQFISGEAAAAQVGRGTAVQRDVIVGDAVMIQVFPNSSLQVSPSASLLSSQNLSHSQAMQILASS
jgi:hypothetical protein